MNGLAMVAGLGFSYFLGVLSGWRLSNWELHRKWKQSLEDRYDHQNTDETGKAGIREAS
jgi:hypothetical protein